MTLIDKGTHLEDETTGQKFARATSNGSPKRRKRIRKQKIKPADSDILFGLFLEKERGRLTLKEIADATGWASSTLCVHFKKKGFKDKAERVLAKARKAAPDALTSESVATNLAARILKGAEEHDATVEDLMSAARKHFKGMKGKAILDRAKDVQTVVNIGRQHYRKDADVVAGGNTPVLNVNFLLGIGVSGGVATASGAPHQDSSGS